MLIFTVLLLGVIFKHPLVPSGIPKVASPVLAFKNIVLVLSKYPNNPTSLESVVFEKFSPIAIPVKLLSECLLVPAASWGVRTYPLSLFTSIPVPSHPFNAAILYLLK